ncbi:MULTISPECIES: polyprenol monophosphomannose synthase [Rhodococcus]|jgi:dolichol-phosphate mannosyltransferase|uniref:dolichyl-phosphate beta-D-mannosyltransferase n=1 Tax=Rhodococcus oxybenzonivorans TaxID=1990687 RepID=A0AAE5A6M2_9NOCA|nr:MULTISPECIES: polyprenol monophosphomannose synthase [Rhodococcus]MDV7242142.1 polyprenol monophosphomannose synthase [Rhodococcus oxybenzonivorans]MDV7264609.1 polyprenol monophosphomannose synthase [Rhodococcus oxybenzonivorans]MDV7276363.1 polyprenol monophosphomannose synthase [Rhodococcus oxybenzonivorans]MDV7331630.1 polyprenol monophosphomannose synthase [Rhodococcus oxybenzonivorans]MDV7343852.1 polyprenol monophosphomannose synthase [Rhodococcus oxybenzonivorans]
MESVAPKVTVVVPTYNERDNLPKLVEFLDALQIANMHVLVVDDNSPDGTGDVAEKLAIDAPIPVGVLHRTVKDGLGRAYVAGMTRALDEGADIVIQMDADLSHPAEAIPRMVETLTQTDAAVVLGSRYVAGGAVASDWPWHRKALSAWANFYVNAILRLRVKDATAGFKAWHADTLRAIDVHGVQSNGYAFQVEMNYRTVQRGMRIAEVPIRFEERTDGVSKMSLGVQMESALVPWKLRFSGRAAKRNRARG